MKKKTLKAEVERLKATKATLEYACERYYEAIRLARTMLDERYPRPAEPREAFKVLDNVVKANHLYVDPHNISGAP